MYQLVKKIHTWFHWVFNNRKVLQSVSRTVRVDIYLCEGDNNTDGDSSGKGLKRPVLHRQAASRVAEHREHAIRSEARAEAFSIASR